ncbi:D-2-hydroxyacid dehydrogenase family protein [Roseibium sp. CAU 1637]|uniref:D-2-hydroxyacid dehydrogenase family protein n=1 Tax=Roseibium limicola TaxID=2816037 RepID=A0A939J428_9HYPH|nr:D-2-hydroxyacid dehydrogenase family protein [Roseibium limicola]MBO0344315.1 D-2-hydroxyacid dehydrogenase family protein [Roseibium limicola]
MKLAILDDYFDTLRGLPCFEKLKGQDVTVFNDHLQDTDLLVERLKDFDGVVLFRERTKVTAELLDRLPNLKLISQRSGYPHVDLEACTRNEVLLCSNMHSGTPSFAAAEHTFALILASARQIPAQMASLQAGNWQMGVGKTLRGRTLGVYGYGRIGRAVGDFAKAFGMNVVFWASEASRQRAADDGETVAESREAFFSGCDVVSVHLRLVAATRGVVTAQDLAAMKSGAIFVNTSRAGLIEEGALLAALNQGRPGFAAIDVFDKEPVTDPSDPLVQHPNIIVTPHIGFVTEDEFELQFSDIFDQVAAYADGKPINMINPEVWKG